MKGLFPCLLLIATALAASSEYDSTIRSTIISSTCTDSNFCGPSSKIAPSSFLYSNSSASTAVVDTAASATSSSTHEGTTLYAYDTVSDNASDDVTYTICDENSSCYTTTDLRTSTTLTTTVDGILTTVVTALSSSPSSLDNADQLTVTNALASNGAASASPSGESAVSAQSGQTTHKGTTLYEIDTVSQDDTFDVTRTICDENSSCYTTTDVESSTTLTTTIDGVLTTLVTAVPVSATGNKNAVAASGSGSAKKGTTLYEIDTVSQGDTFDVTRTICDENSSCYTTTDVESSTTLTTTIDGILTTLVTAVPVSTTNAAIATASTSGSKKSGKKGTTLYEVDTVSQDDTFDVTRTICDENSSCYTTTDVESSTTLTTTIDGILTTLVTAVPVSATNAATQVAHSKEARIGGGAADSASETASKSVTDPKSVGGSDPTFVQGETTSSVYNSNNANNAVTSAVTLTNAQASAQTGAVGEKITDGANADDKILTVTRTVCDSNSVCHTTVDLESSTTYTTTINGVKTLVTTVCPVSDQASITAGEVAATTAPTTVPNSEAKASAVSSAVSEVNVSGHDDTTNDVTNTNGLTATKTHESTTVITVTSCSDNKCSKVPKTTGLTLVTITQGTLITSYTTYCPLSELEQTSDVEDASEPKTKTANATPVITIPTEEASSTGTKSGASKAYSTVNVITNNIVTQSSPKETSSDETSSESGSVSGISSSESISVYEGGATNHLIKSTGILGLVISFLFMIV